MRSNFDTMSIRPPDTVVELVDRLERAGFETWCVGGAVRDALLGHPDLDWDLATAATPQQIQSVFRRTVPVGIEFGTVGVFDRAGRMHEVTTFRRDVETDGRHAVVSFGASLEEDLARRDFTINAIAWSPVRGELRDPFDGRGDLARKVVRTVGNAADRMAEDRLRALRAIRFAARFRFEIDPTTWAAIRDSAPHLRRLSPERVRQELEKTMEQVVAPAWAIERWQASGAMAVLVPELADSPAVARATLDYLPRPGPPKRPDRVINRLTALFLPVPPGRLAGVLKDLRFSNSDAKWIGELAARWRELDREMSDALTGSEPLPPRTARRWATRAGRTRIRALLRIAHAVWSARRAAGLPAPPPRRVYGGDRVILRALFDPIEIADLAVDGEDLVGSGIRPGPEVGKILRALVDVVLDDPARNTRDDLLATARALSRPTNGEE